MSLVYQHFLHNDMLGLLNDRNVELATMLASQVLIGLQAVIDEDEALL